jgi:hypothetical protein
MVIEHEGQRYKIFVGPDPNRTAPATYVQLESGSDDPEQAIAKYSSFMDKVTEAIRDPNRPELSWPTAVTGRTIGEPWTGFRNDPTWDAYCESVMRLLDKCRALTGM